MAKCLKLVAASSMNADAQTMWLAAAVDALEDIRAVEVAAVSAEIRRSVTRPAQIVPEIARLVAGRRQRSRQSANAPPPSPAFMIDWEAQERRGKAKSRAEINAAWERERQARIDAGMTVPPRQPALSREELAAMPQHIASLGLAYGFLERRNGELKGNYIHDSLSL